MDRQRSCHRSGCCRRNHLPRIHSDVPGGIDDAMNPLYWTGWTNGVCVVWWRAIEYATEYHQSRLLALLEQANEHVDYWHTKPKRIVVVVHSLMSANHHRIAVAAVVDCPNFAQRVRHRKWLVGGE